jgi:branched-chain amino acid aminotransferase
MATEVTEIASVPNMSTPEVLEHIARDTKVLISMPFVRGITPRVLVERGRRETQLDAAGLERCYGIFRVDEIGLPVFDRGLLYGDGLFEGVLVSKGRLFQWREHVARLYATADRLQIEIPYTPPELSEHILEVVENAESSGRAPTYLRLVVTRGIGDLGINPAKCAGSTLYCIASRIELYPESLYEQGVHLALARHIRRSSREVVDARLKSCNYLNNILALLETSGRGTQETLMLSRDGFVAEATTDNVFAVVRNPGWESDPSKVTVSTPATDYCLKGITRELVLGYGRTLGFKVEESAVMVPADLIGEDREVFLTGTGAGLVPVVTVDGRIVHNGVPGPITRKLRHLLELDMEMPEMGLSVQACRDEIVRYLECSGHATRSAVSISKDFIRNMFQTIDSRDWEGLDRAFRADMTYDRPGYERLVGYERVKKFYRDERVIVSGSHVLEGIVVNNDNGACWGRFIGKHKNGSSIDESFADVYTFQDGKIKTRRSFFFRPAV